MSVEEKKMLANMINNGGMGGAGNTDLLHVIEDSDQRRKSRSTLGSYMESALPINIRQKSIHTNEGSSENDDVSLQVRIPTNKSSNYFKTREVFENDALSDLRNIEAYKKLPLERKMEISDKCNQFEIKLT